MRWVACVTFAIAAACEVRAETPPIPSPLTFEAALDLATSRNLGIDAARRQRAVREAAVRTARQIPNPDIVGEITRDVPHQAFVVDFPIELGGKRARRVDLATEELSLAGVALQAELRTVRRELRQSFYSLLAADERVRLAEAVLDIARRLREAAQSRFETGAAPRLEVLQADLGVTRAETDVDLARSLRASAQAALNGVLNVAPDQTLAVSGSLSDHTTTPPYDRALGVATASNPDLTLFDRQIAIEQRRVTLLRVERLPTPVFSVGGVFNAPGEFDVGPRAGFSIGLPLFSRNQGEIAASIATASQLRASRQAAERRITNAVYGAAAKVETERRQVAAYRQQLVPTATDLESLIEESYRAGRSSVLAVLDAQRIVRDLTREALQAELELQLAVAELEELLGTPLP